MRLKHLLSVFLTLLTLSVGQMWGAEVQAYQLTCSTSGSSNSYGGNCDVEEDDITWNVNGNSQQNPWRFGGNKISNQTRTLYSKTAIDDDITKIAVAFGTNSGSITVNSVTLEVYSTASLAAAKGTGDVSSHTISYAASTTRTITVPSGKSWEGRYYCLKMALTVSGSSNKYITVNSITFYKEESSCEKITTAPIVTATTDNQTINLSWTNQTGASSYTVTRTPADGTVGTPSKSGDTWSCAITGLTNGTAYTWTVTPVGDGSTYCASGNTAASASATPNVSRTITYYDKDGSHTTTLADGTNIATALNALYGANGPISCNTEDYEYFVGWKDGSISGTATSVTLLSTEVVNETNAGKTYYAVWSDTEPADYSTTYSSNVNGVSGVNVSIGGTSYPAKKLGSSGSGGSFSVTAPSGTTKLYLHAQGWNSKSATLTLSTNVGSISPSTAQSLTANSAISGSSTTFTLTTLTNDFFEYTLSNITSNATITIATQSERGVIWGVNAISGSGSAKYITNCCTSLGQINGSFFWPTLFSYLTC